MRDFQTMVAKLGTINDATILSINLSLTLTLIFFNILQDDIRRHIGLTFASTIVLYTGFFLSQTDVVVVFTFVLMCDVIVVAQWRGLICFARNAHASMCCFSRCLTYSIKWACSAVAGMVICQDNKVYVNGNRKLNRGY